MNLWKASTLVLATAVVALGAQNIASANPGGERPAPVAGDYPHVRIALEHLRAARAELGMAEHNRNGWAERAKEGTDRAIWETRQALDW
jgi:hypothetical protein